MKYEKSCGAVIFRDKNGAREFLVVLNRKGKNQGHWGFPKGHIEEGENEYTTAAREIFEETGLSVVFCGNVKETSKYSPRPYVEKEVVYFLATTRNNGEVYIQQSEIADYKWCTLAQAKNLLTYDGKILDNILKKL